MKIDYSKLTFTELVNKIGNSRFFDLPKMLKEAFTRLSGGIFTDAPSDGDQYVRQDGEWELITPSEPPYKVYTALLSQSGTDAPVATVLENTLGGDIVWNRNETGVYSGILTGAFLNKNVALFINDTESQIADNTERIRMRFRWIDDNLIALDTSKNYVLEDEILFYTSIKIEVYDI